MTKDKFIKLYRKRGYHVEDWGRMVMISLRNYTAIHHFREDGEYDTSMNAFWTLRAQAFGVFALAGRPPGSDPAGRKGARRSERPFSKEEFIR